MIVSHEHRFIFVKTRKTAGTSIEVFLEQLAGGTAIVTPVNPPVPGHQPRNHLPESRLARRRIERAQRGDFTADDERRGMAFYNHIPARVVRERLGARRFDAYFKFCFERDPWEKTVSWYFFLHPSPDGRPPFAEFVARGALPVDWPLYTIDDRPAMDFIGRFEELEHDLDAALRALGLDVPVHLTAEKRGSRPSNAGAAADLYDTATRDLVATAFAREIERFGYAPPSVG